MSKKSKRVVARLTAERSNGKKLIIEVLDNATFSIFYLYYSQVGKKWSTKQLLRATNRNDGLVPPHKAYQMTPGLEAIAEQLKLRPDVVSVKIQIIKKRLYKYLITAAADTLGMTRLTTTDLNGARAIPVGRQSFRIVSKVNHSKLHRGLVGVS